MTTTPAETPPRELTLAERIGATNFDGKVDWLNGIFIGEPGAGKTYLYGTITDWPEEFLPALLVDLDGGTDTLRFKTQIQRTKPIRSLAQLQALYDEISADCSKTGGYYKSICLDNISELQKMDMNEVMLEAKRTANNPDNVDIHVPSPREWGKNNERMRIIIRAFRDLPCHTICMAHSQEREDKTTKVDRIWPGMPGQMRHEILGFFSVGGYISIYEDGGEVKRQIQFKKTRKVQARDRFQVLPDVMMDNPTLPQIWKIIKDSGATIKQPDPLAIPTAQPATAPTPVESLQGAISK